MALVTLFFNCIHSMNHHHGIYRSYPGYFYDSPQPLINHIYFGLPKGGYSNNGQPYGMLAFVHKYGGWNRAWRYYYSRENKLRGETFNKMIALRKMEELKSRTLFR